VVGRDRVFQSGRVGMLGSEPVIDGQHLCARRLCDAPSNVAIKGWRANDKAAAVQEQDVAMRRRGGGRYQVRPNPVGINPERLRFSRGVPNEALGGGRDSPMLLDAQLAMVAAFDEPAQTQPHHLRSQTHITSHLCPSATVAAPAPVILTTLPSATL
jgi:hypothetical protein